jgi:hypothetical protein
LCSQHSQFSRRANFSKIFYSRGGRWSFRTAWVKGDVTACFVDVRSSPNNGHQTAVLQCPLRASGHGAAMSII